MKHNLLKIWFVSLFIIATNLSIYAQKNLENQISDSLTVIVNSYTRVGKVNLINFSPNSRTKVITVSVNERLGYMPFRPDNVKRIYAAINKIVARKFTGYTVYCQVENQNIESLIPDFYRTEHSDTSKQFMFHE